VNERRPTEDKIAYSEQLSKRKGEDPLGIRLLNQSKHPKGERNINTETG
jgi:hypothetical protein